MCKDITSLRPILLTVNLLFKYQCVYIFACINGINNTINNYNVFLIFVTKTPPFTGKIYNDCVCKYVCYNDHYCHRRHTALVQRYAIYNFLHSFLFLFCLTFLLIDSSLFSNKNSHIDFTLSSVKLNSKLTNICYLEKNKKRFTGF